MSGGPGQAEQPGAEAPLAEAAAVLEVEKLSISFLTEAGEVRAVDDVSLLVRAREIYGLVGESGSGKTTLALGALRYLAPNGRVTAGRVRLAGRDLLSLSAQQLRGVWGGEVAMVYQNPSTALNPSLTIGRQLQEVVRAHGGLARGAAMKRVLEALAQVDMPDPAAACRLYPHQLSGGMVQRCVIAMALMTKPRLLIMDEPTTALDVTTQAVVLDLISRLRREVDTAILYITHDMGVVARLCDRVGVMYGGQLVEEAEVRTLFRSPRHPYTRQLLESVPRIRADAAEGMVDDSPALLQATDLSKRFRRGARGLRGLLGGGARPVTAVDHVGFSLRRGRTLGLVGESGSGKTTTARLVLGLTPPDGGQVTLDGTMLAPEARLRSRSTLRRMQMVFQNPDSSLNPRHTVREIVGRPASLLRGMRGERLEAEVARLLQGVRLPETYAGRLPGELSGGEKQRVAIARAFAAVPDIVMCDEPISSLDVRVQAALLELLGDLQRDQGAAYLFVSHDLAAVQHLSHEIAVMYRGRLVEWGQASRVLNPPYHPYTEALLSAVLLPDPDIEQSRVREQGPPSGPVDAGMGAGTSAEGGCSYRDRCRRCLGEVCAVQAPPLRRGQGGHFISCHILPDELAGLQRPALHLSGEPASQSAKGEG